jgi:hypothetical protein
VSLPPNECPSNFRLAEYGTDAIPYAGAGPDPYRLGPFFAQLQSARERLVAAARRGMRALGSGNPIAEQDAAAELAMALEEEHTIRNDLADLILNGLRVAAEERPADLYEVLAPLLLPGLQADIDECAAAVAALERDRRAGR